MAEAKLNKLGRGLVRLKMRLPIGAKFQGAESDYIIDQWTAEKKQVASRETSLEASANEIARHISKVTEDIPEAANAMREARTKFKMVKSPIAKEKWARKLVVRAKLHEQLRHSKQTMEANAERVKDAVDDAKVVFNMLENRISEAKIYRNLNGGLHLVGKALAEARKKHQMYEVETQNFEVSVEAIESEVGGSDRKQLIAEATEIEKKLTGKGGDK